MNLIDHYPETLREIYDHIEEVVTEAGATSTAMDVALHVTEWIRKHWSRRTLIPAWWGAIAAAPADEDGEMLPEVVAQVDPLRTVRGRELRDAVLEILLTNPNYTGGQPCHLAVAIAACVEGEWSRQQVYIPQAAAVDRAIRDAQVWNDFNGFSSIETVIQKHNVSQSVVYEIFRRQQKERSAREQPSLFDFAQES